MLSGWKCSEEKYLSEKRERNPCYIVEIDHVKSGKSWGKTFGFQRNGKPTNENISEL